MKDRLKVTWGSGEVILTRPFVTRWAAEKKAKIWARVGLVTRVEVELAPKGAEEDTAPAEPTPAA